MHDIANKRYIKPSSSDIRADQYSSLTILISPRLYIINCSLKSVQTLESLLLLHFRMQAIVLNFEEIKQTV